MKVKSENEVAQSCPTLCNPMGCSPPGSSVHGIFQARVLEWGAIAIQLGPGKLLTPNDETPSNFVTPATQNGKKRTDAQGYNAEWGIVLIFLFVLPVQFFTFISPVLCSEKLKVSPWASLLCSFWLCLANGRQ